MPSAAHPFVILPSVESTNNYAMAQVHAGLASGGNAWFALEQTRGKGQRGKSWKSTKGENITMTTVLEPKTLLLSEQFVLNMAVALACYDLLKSILKDELWIKWPNDIYWNDKKAGGILIENVVHGNTWQHAIVGTGLNINQVNFPEELANPVSLRQVTGKSHDVLALAGELYELIIKRYNSIPGHKEALYEEYNSVLYKLHENVRLKRNNIVFQARINGVSAQGLLMAQTAFEEEFAVGEVEWLRS
jgi:BirA family biotin operon repressor/biotin-[acetyl-CoA-carboxylase] ligase